MFSTKSSGLDSGGAAADSEAQTPAQDRARRGREMDCGEFLGEGNGSGNLATAFAAEEVVMEAIHYFKAVVLLCGVSSVLLLFLMVGNLQAGPTTIWFRVLSCATSVITIFSLSYFIGLLFIGPITIADKISPN